MSIYQIKKGMDSHVLVYMFVASWQNFNIFAARLNKIRLLILDNYFTKRQFNSLNVTLLFNEGPNLNNRSLTYCKTNNLRLNFHVTCICRLLYVQMTIYIIVSRERL